MTRSLIILPDDSAQPVLDAINASTRSVRIKMFAFSHQPLLDAVVSAHQRGVDVRVMLNPERRDGETDNDTAREVLQKFGIDVCASNPAFDLTHEKSMVVDHEADCKSANSSNRGVFIQVPIRNLSDRKIMDRNMNCMRTS